MKGSDVSCFNMTGGYFTMTGRMVFVVCREQAVKEFNAFYDGPVLLRYKASHN
jgi:hypothetical protein